MKPLNCCFLTMPKFWGYTYKPMVLVNGNLKNISECHKPPKFIL